VSANDQRPIRNLRIASELFDLALRVKVHQLRKKHPDWSEEKVKSKALELIEKGTR
jgi:hypothetical protein